jgi:hypothetical protein
MAAAANEFGLFPDSFGMLPILLIMYSHTFLTSIDKFNLEQKRSFNFAFLIVKTEFLFSKKNLYLQLNPLKKMSKFHCWRFGLRQEFFL